MKSPKFTKGKWTIGKSEDDYKALSIDVECGDGLMEIVAISGIIDDCRHECEESKSNAHLISAAPEMYEALEYLINCVGDNDAEMIETLLAKARGDNHG